MISKKTEDELNSMVLKACSTAYNMGIKNSIIAIRTYQKSFKEESTDFDFDSLISIVESIKHKGEV